MTTLSSRERMLLAFRHEQPDYIPLIFNTFGFQPPPYLAWSNQVEEAQRWLSLGVDGTLILDGIPIVYHPDVEVRQWVESVPGERWPLMVKEYDTPAGVLRQEVYRTDDWITPDWPGHRELDDGIELFDDYNVGRSRSFLIETEEDLEKLKYLFYPLSDGVISQVRERAAALARQAEQLGVLLEGQGSAGIDLAVWLCGVETLVFMAIDRPQMFEALLDIIQVWDKRNTEILLETPVELITRRAWYEGTTFWSPKIFRKLFLSRIKELTDIVHQGGRMMGYKMSAGFMPLLDAFLEVSYDVHYFIDPLMGGTDVDLHKVKAVFNNKIAVAGGVNSAVTLERGSRDEIRRAVFDAVETLGPEGGFILTPVDCISSSTPWENIEVLIEAWKEVRHYPLK